jgi:hypothetical protein
VARNEGVVKWYGSGEQDPKGNGLRKRHVCFSHESHRAATVIPIPDVIDTQRKDGGRGVEEA